MPLTPGRWRADICLWDSPYGESGFTVVLWMRPTAPSSRWLVYVGGPASGEPGVAEGRWTDEFEITAAVPNRTMVVTAEAGGEWTVVFTRLDDTDDTG